jgi:hypothetical protein
MTAAHFSGPWRVCGRSTTEHVYCDHVGCWIGHGSLSCLMPHAIILSAIYSPDLTTLDSSLWGTVCAPPVEQAFSAIMPQRLWQMSHRIWWNMRFCFERDRLVQIHSMCSDSHHTVCRIGDCDFAVTLCDWRYCKT